MKVRALFELVKETDLDPLLAIYNAEHDPEITKAQLQDFITQLLAIEPERGDDEIDLVAWRSGRDIHIAGSGWGYYDIEGAVWAHIDNWDVEYRPAAEVLSLEIVNRAALPRLELTMWLLEELGVYLGRPRARDEEAT